MQLLSLQPEGEEDHHMATKTMTRPAAKPQAPQKTTSGSMTVSRSRETGEEIERTEERKETTSQRALANQRGGPPAALMGRMQADAGKGVSTDQADNLVPLIYLLQPLSPQCIRGGEKTIKGAEAGDIWLRNANEEDQIIKCDDGLVFQPCWFSKDWVEWLPNRGGFVDRHSQRPEIAELVDREGDDGTIRKVWTMPNGNNVVETRYHAGFAVLPDGRALPYTIPLSSTGHTVSKAWMFAMNSEALPDGTKAPSFAILYRLTPKLRSRNNKTWYQYEVSKVGWVETEAEYERGLALYEAFASGEKRIEEETDVGDETEGSLGDQSNQYQVDDI